MRTSLLITMLCFLFLTNCQSQKWGNHGIEGTGSSTEKELKLAAFNGIKLTLAANVYLKQGSTQNVRIVAQQNIIDLFKTSVEDGVWKISTTEPIKNHSPIKIYITVPNMSYVGLSGSGDIITENTFSSNEEVTVRLSGSGNLRFKTTARSTNVSISGSGNIELDGSTQSIDISISGSGDVDAFNFAAANCNISISGSGGAKVAAQEELNVKVSGSGDVYYRGRPTIVSRISGSGDLHASNGG